MNDKQEQDTAPRTHLVEGAHSRKQVERLIEAMKGIDHFKDALNWREDHLSKALRQWIEEGSSALAALSSEGQP